ncbi:MAG: glycerate kinase [Thermoanaerobaculia bacterium]
MAWTTLREDALACLRAAIAAVDPEELVRVFLEAHPESLPAGVTVRVAGIGKAAQAMASGACQVLGRQIEGGVLVLPRGGAGKGSPGFQIFEGGHPIPDEGSAAGGAAIRELAAGLTRDELLLCLISGGGSALTTLPPEEISLADLQETTDRLLRAGATIGDLNAVRKHLDLFKGGRLAAAAAPSRVLALVLSDVVGDPLDVIASGPVSPDPTRFGDAIAVLERFGISDKVPRSVQDYLRRGEQGEVPESPGEGDPCFANVEVQVVGNNRLAAEAALSEAAARGYHSLLLTTLLTGEAREVGRFLAAIGLEVERAGRPVPPPAALVAAGETTVTVRGRGRGGRNQEVALGAAWILDGSEKVLVASIGTDGIDGPTDAAGAIATGGTLARARERDLDAEAALAENDAYPFFHALEDLIVTGPTGTNVMDVQLVLVRQ